MLDGSYYFECDCGSDEHTLRCVLDLEDADDKMIYVCVFLNNCDNIFVRIWKAIKYIFGYKCKYGHWDEFVMTENTVKRFEEMFTKYKEGLK